MDSSRKGFVKKWSEILIFLTLLWIFIQYHIFYSIVHRDVCRMKETDERYYNVLSFDLRHCKRKWLDVCQFAAQKYAIFRLYCYICCFLDTK